MMDVGAKAGYFTEKSPKMMLLEWCQQQKRPTPRYRSTAADGAVAAKCKVDAGGEQKHPGAQEELIHCWNL